MYTEFGKLVCKRLIELDMTQKELAERIGVERMYINHIVKGRRSGSKYVGEIRRILDIEEEQQVTKQVI